MENILNFPQTTIVNLNVPKKKFYVLCPGSAWRQYLALDYESITWLYKLSPTTLNVEDGKNVHEIDGFYCKMKRDKYSINSFCAMDGLVPRHTFFIIEHEGKYDLLMHHKEMTIVNGEQVWIRGGTEMKNNITIDADTLKIQGQSMDAVYSSLLSQISGLHISTEEEYKIQADLRRQIEKKNIQIGSLEMKIKAEKQFNRQIELNTLVRQLKKNISSLTNKLNRNTK
ncbi:MAG: DUF4391 domain-containing protein [Prevotella sp.]|nr:DUF4391 domain-containing protein [Prevotella sp.]